MEHNPIEDHGLSYDNEETEASDDGVVYVEKGDDQMNWAMEKARLTVSYFRDSLRAPQPLQSNFALKARLQEGDEVEHIWLSNVSLDEDGIFYGTIDNAPVRVTNVEMGTKMAVPPGMVSDWMVLENGRLIGGYTIRAAREALEEEQQAAFDASVGFEIDLGVDYFEHNMRTPEGAILCLEDAYTSGNLDAAVACKDFETEAIMMLDQQDDFPKVEELIKDMAQVLELSFREHMLEHGMPSFAGVLRAFPERIRVEDDLYMITEVCFHPDGGATLDRLLVTRKNGEWRVGPPINDEEEE
ncbi:MAG: DUF2314 domain-containing protein [Bacteroidota bacterium]